jgi:hypothetical protein
MEKNKENGKLLWKKMEKNKENGKLLWKKMEKNGKFYVKNVKKCKILRNIFVK